MHHFSLNASLAEYTQIKNAITDSNSIQEAVDAALSIALEAIQCQAASYFLLTKLDFIERVQIKGYDFDGSTIDKSWFEHEGHHVGNSFTGRAFIPNGDTKFGQAIISSDLAKEDLDIRSQREYVAKLGSLDCVMTIPLSGMNRTYGALEFINKFPNNTNETACFTLKDIFIASLIACALSGAISSIRRQGELDLISETSNKLIIPFSGEHFELQEILEEILEDLIIILDPYQAAILRIHVETHDLSVLAKAGDNVDWSNWDDSSQPRGVGFANYTFETEIPIIVNNIRNRLDEFLNKDWILDNDFQSYICVPLIVADSVIGTLSVFTSYLFTFDQSDVDFLTSLGEQIATISKSSEAVNELQRVADALADAGDVAQKDAISASGSMTEGIRHDYKNVLLEIFDVLLDVEEANSATRRNSINDLKQMIQDEVSNLTAELSRKTYVPSQVNHLVRQVTRRYRLTKKHIVFKQNFDPDVPYLLLNEGSIRDAIENLVSNAVKAVEAGDDWNKSIEISTSIVHAGILYVQIEVTDNGIGIKKENMKNIFKRAFSTYEDGTGFGLYKTQKIVEQHSGEILVSSSVGKGSTFLLRLPIDELTP